MMQCSGTTCRPQRALAFTLVEVMISVALVLALIIGVNQVFKVAADTVGAGQALSAKIRDARAIQAVFHKELQHFAKADESPFLIIDSRTNLAFRSAADRNSDLDFDYTLNAAQQVQAMLTVDFDGNNQEGEANVPGELLNRAIMSTRVHRADTFSFFARDLYRRQTGNPGVYTADMSSNEVWVTYQHLRVFNQLSPDPNPDAVYLQPGFAAPAAAFVNGADGAAANPKNYYASDWVLGRVAMLLVSPQDTNGDGDPDTIYRYPYPLPGVDPQRFWLAKPTDLAQALTPFGEKAQIDNAAGPDQITWTRYDLLGTNMGQFGAALKDYVEHTRHFTDVAVGQQIPAYDSAALGGDPQGDWWKLLPCFPGDPTAALGTHGSYENGRFRCNPYPTKPLDSRKAAEASPVMLNNCTDFAVEFAGDYLTQAPPGGAAWGDITAVASDGVLDFYIETIGTAPAVPFQRIRWYGFPRDVNGDGVIRGTIAAAPGAHHSLVDVVPLRDIVMSFDPTIHASLVTTKANKVGFERNLDDSTTAGPLNTLLRRTNYAALPGAAAATQGIDGGEYYCAVWGPQDTNRPKLVRLITVVDDPNGRLGVGQRYEYVFNLP